MNMLHVLSWAEIHSSFSILPLLRERSIKNRLILIFFSKSVQLCPISLTLIMRCSYFDHINLNSEIMEEK